MLTALRCMSDVQRPISAFEKCLNKALKCSSVAVCEILGHKRSPPLKVKGAGNTRDIQGMMSVQTSCRVEALIPCWDDAWHRRGKSHYTIKKSVMMF